MGQTILNLIEKIKRVSFKTDDNTIISFSVRSDISDEDLTKLKNDLVKNTTKSIIDNKLFLVELINDLEKNTAKSIPDNELF